MFEFRIYHNMRNFFRQKRSIYQGSSSSGKDSVRIISLGGAANVTKNMFLYEYCYDGKIRDILIVDCGIGFPDADMYGVDLVIPDVRYLENKKHLIRGLVFTHGHEDHIGGLPYLLSRLGNFPMWGTTLTAAFVNLKLQEMRTKTRVTPVTFDKVLRIGPFTVSFIRVTHSVPDAANLVIQSPIGTFYHGSDYKFDFNPLDGKLSELNKITEAGKRRVLCLLTDSLGSERPGFTPSEQIVGVTVEKELSFSQGKVLFTTQSSNISRIQRACELAVQSGRSIAFFGRSIDKNVEESIRLGYMRLPREAIVRDRDLKRIPPEKQFLVVAGSQGQSDSALSKIAHGINKYVSLNDTDTVIFSADPIPGHENDVNRVIDAIYRMGARVSYSDIMADLHVSGHGSQGDMMLMLSAVGPKYVMPIGGTYKHIMQYRRLAQELGYDKKDVLIPDDGAIVEFKRDVPPRIIEHIELENVMVDALGVGDVGDIVLRDRQTIATEGIVVVVVPMEESTGKITSAPEIISRGFVFMKSSGKLIDGAKRIVIETVRMKKDQRVDWGFVRKNIQESLAQYLARETGRHPLIVPVVVEV